MHQMVRNPSPPPEINPELSENGNIGDNIGTTVFSQHWLFQQLMDVLKYVDVSEESDGGNVSLVELDKNIEDSMCLLWDMSVELEVAKFLMEFKAKDIFIGVLIKTNAPRLQEIILGILGNMATHKDIRDHFAHDNDFMMCILQTLASTDVPSLIQTLRFVNSCVVNEIDGNNCIRFIIEFESSRESLKFILSSCLNVELLKSTLKLLYECLDKEDDFVLKLTSDEYFKAIIDAGHQIILAKEYEALDEFWHVVQLISTFSSACKILEIFRNELISLAKEYFIDLTSEDSLTPDESRIPPITAAFATVNAILKASSTEHLHDFECLKDSTLMDFFNNFKGNLSDLIRYSLNDDEPRCLIIKETLIQLDKLLARLNTVFV